MTGMRSGWGPALALVAVAGLTAGAVQAAKNPKTPAAPAVAQGVQVAIDPVTGAVRQPTRQEAAVLAPAAQPKAIRSIMKPTRLANGGQLWVLGDEHMNYTVVRLNADGSPMLACADSQTAAVEIVEQPATGEILEVK